MSASVSVIVPVYNVSPFIGDCIKSVMNQSYQGEMECILIDDGCTDDSMMVLGGLLKDYQGPIHIAIYHHEKNRGLSAARNTGTRYASGEYIFYLDGDDVISTNCIESLMEQTISNPEVELVQGNAEAIPVKLSASYTRHYPVLHAKSNEEVRYCYYQNRQMPCNAWNKLVKRVFILKNDLFFREGALYEDVLWSFYLMKCLSNVIFVSDVTYYTRFRPGSIMSGTDKLTSAIHYQQIYYDIYNNLTPNNEEEELAFYAKAFANVYIRHGHVMPKLKNVYKLYRDKAMEYRMIGVCLRLSICRFLGTYKCGWAVAGIMRRIEHPSRLKDDFERILHRMR